MDALVRQQRLITALADPVRYPHPVQRVERIETHISTVLLAGDFAYKIKKPLDLGFLDFTTLERRRFYCEEELRLNRRLAPKLYLDVVSVTGSADDPRLDGAGPVVEYAVRMRRFPQQALLSAQLASGELQAEMLDRLGAELARFHAAVAVAPAHGPYGRFPSIAEPARDNLAMLRRLAPARLAAIDRLHDFTEAELARLAPSFEQRRMAGAVRECHGDLHLDNIISWNDELMIFDGIEFDPALRWIDVMNDLAFALMDLDRRDAPRLTWRLKGAYLEASGDYAGLAVLRFYQAYRALVRAKIAALRLQQVGEGPERAAADAELERYLQLAESYAQPRRPCLVITCGASGSGKSTAARFLVEQGGFVRLRSDLERKRLHGLGADARSASPLGGKLYSPAATDATYQRLLQLAEAGLAAGERVVVDATFLERERRDGFARLAHARSVPFHIVLLQADPSLLAARVERRLALGGDPSEATLAVLARQLETAQWPMPAEATVLALSGEQADWPSQLTALTG